MPQTALGWRWEAPVWCCSCARGRAGVNVSHTRRAAARPAHTLLRPRDCARVTVVPAVCLGPAVSTSQSAETDVDRAAAGRSPREVVLSQCLPNQGRTIVPEMAPAPQWVKLPALTVDAVSDFPGGCCGGLPLPATARRSRRCHYPPGGRIGPPSGGAPAATWTAGPGLLLPARRAGVTPPIRRAVKAGPGVAVLSWHNTLK